MSQPTHTPSPWTVTKTPKRNDGRHEYAIHAIGPRQNGDGDTVFTVATLLPSYDPATRPWIHDYTENDAEANARLIAAAPDMLRALQEAHTHAVGMTAYLATCSTEVIVENLETTISALRTKCEYFEAVIRKAREV